MLRHAAAAAAILLMAGPAFAADRHVDIINKTGQTMTHFYASNSGTNSWEEDILGRDTLDNDDTVAVDINDGTGACRFDFKAVFESGASLIRNNINVCQISSFTYNR